MISISAGKISESDEADTAPISNMIALKFGTAAAKITAKNHTKNLCYFMIYKLNIRFVANIYM